MSYSSEESHSLKLKTVEELKSANSDYSNLVMGIYYEFGYIVEQNFNKAKSHYERSKHPFSFLRLGFLYNSGYGVRTDFRKAGQYYRRSKEFYYKEVPEFLLVLEKTYKNNTHSDVLYTNYMQDEGVWSCDFATSRLEELSSTGNVWALYQLGHAYASSSGVECRVTDNSKAKNYYHRAANQGHPQSMNNLSATLEDLRGNLLANRPLLEESVFWLRKAADTGVVLSQINLGLEYMQLTGRLNHDPNKGLYWLTEAQKQGSSRAKFLLGLSYLTVPEVVNTEKGIGYLLEAADAGECQADYELSRYYLFNEDNVLSQYLWFLNTDLKKAKNHFKKSIESGCQDFENLASKFH
ncbi:tetratricopeptide repeat protein [Pseudoalteromonas luteoviolacea]|uniref:Sel1 repeat family protein n=1 Tax=Pseudoalteromonas luteoviolacea S4060-1 TaxID=1365257 RepID=A0A161YL87_9GAMM|nr:tetratricopeptide repeat protein [Pseudoalteromonas luteoviolacea]KZN62193.1 hypothetical protein N478_25615 [Pseudoalteromonas luteoviolacea S4060-1]